MEIRQLAFSGQDDPAAITAALGDLKAFAPTWALVFASVEFLSRPAAVAAVIDALEGAVIVGCSTAGEIARAGVFDHRCVVTGVKLRSGSLRTAYTEMADMADSRAAGERIGAQLRGPGLRAAMVFAPGVRINGAALVEGISAVIGPGVPISGGLAGDAGAFRRTLTLDHRGVSERGVVAIGLVGEQWCFGHGSFGGWEPFGPARQVTRCDGNILYELDGEPALTIYKRYLGSHAAGLPASGLLFPFAMLGSDHTAIGTIRTILGVDEATGSLTLAGTIEPKGYLKLMHASTDRLVGGAERAAEAAGQHFTGTGDSLAVLVSCVGRKLVMGDRVDEEIEIIGDVCGPRTTLAGFYSYGEIGPLGPAGPCQLHNQTMTVTWLGERA